MSQLTNCCDFIALHTEIVQCPALTSHFQAQICFAIIRLSYRASTIKPIPVHPTQPPPQILQAPSVLLERGKERASEMIRVEEKGGKIYK